MENGSSLYNRFVELSANKEEGSVNLNEHLENLEFYSEEERKNVKKMESKYKLIFVNPIDLKN